MADSQEGGIPFAAFILTHGRPERVPTYSTLKRHGYTGPVFFVVDDEDKALPAYRAKYGADRVLVFSKAEIAATFDEGDNFGDRRAIIYARNVCWRLARERGIRAFIQLDDDYNAVRFRFDERGYFGHWPVPSLDRLFALMAEYLRATPFLSIALAQGGDHIGGGASGYLKSIRTKRKAMNTFVCLTDRPFQFSGRINEDVNTYTELQRRGGCFLTLLGAGINQGTTQQNAGGMTELYLDSGTYVKSFYSVMYAPSCVVVAPLKDLAPGREGWDTARRLHHRVKWEACAPLILPERIRKASRRAALPLKRPTQEG